MVELLELVQLLRLVKKGSELFKPLKFGIQDEQVLFKILHMYPLLLRLSLHIDLIESYRIEQVVQ